MTNPRLPVSNTQNLALLMQVGKICPLCDVPLFYTKNGKSQKKYEVAHIYPLNPKTDEMSILAGLEKLSIDVNDEKNLIPLCVGCHTIFDKPRTADEYLKLVSIKKALIKNDEHLTFVGQYQIEADIKRIIDSLYSDDVIDVSAIDFETVQLDRKLSGEMLNMTRKKIKNNVSDYFSFVRQRFSEMDAYNPDSANLIATQVKLFYLKQKSLNITKEKIFYNIVDWLSIKTKPLTSDAPEIIISFFIQNCEVFE